MDGLPRTMVSSSSSSTRKGHRGAFEDLLLNTRGDPAPNFGDRWVLPGVDSSDVLPDLARALSGLSASAPPGPRLVSEVTADDLDRFVRLVRSGVEAPLDNFLEALTSRGVTAERVIDELVSPTARRMGEAWTNDECSFVEVTLVGGRLQRVVRTLAQKSPGKSATSSSGRMPRALLTSLPGQQHTLGLTVLAAHFRLAGWDVRVGPPVGRENAVSLVRRMEIDVVGLSIPLEELMPAAREEVRRLRASTMNPDMGILMGGPARSADPGRAEELGADAVVPSARLAPGVAQDFT